MTKVLYYWGDNIARDAVNVPTGAQYQSKAGVVTVYEEDAAVLVKRLGSQKLPLFTTENRRPTPDSKSKDKIVMVAPDQPGEIVPGVTAAKRVKKQDA